jgi:hypothetical protein
MSGSAADRLDGGGAAEGISAVGHATMPRFDAGLATAHRYSFARVIRVQQSTNTSRMNFASADKTTDKSQPTSGEKREILTNPKQEGWQLVICAAWCRNVVFAIAPSCLHPLPV